MNLYFIILSFQTIGGAGQISTANGGTIPINDIRGTLLAKTNQSNKRMLLIIFPEKMTTLTKNYYL